VQEALAAAEGADISLVVLAGSREFCRPFLQVLPQIQGRGRAPPLLVLAQDSSEAFAIDALRAGASEYLTEPAQFETFLRAVVRWIPADDAAPTQVDLTGGDTLVGDSPGMQALRAQIRRIAATDCNVLITGETGTGKELVAQLIHQNSPRSKHPLVCINCAAIPDSLLESELFGYERGAFTGAGRANEGKLMAAHRGSVFFDEVGDMSPLAQAKVLRAIETKQVQRLGASRTYGTDIRIIAATHRDLDDLSAPEAFRRDLYFRLNVGRIKLTPLRERKMDVAGLVERLIQEMNQKLSRRIDGVNGAAMRTLVNHDWPGNVRELKNVIERAFITCDCAVIGQDDLSHILPCLPAPAESAMAAESAIPAEDDDLRCLQDALATCNGNKSRAAQKLNWSRMTLYRKLAKYALAQDHPRKYEPTSTDSGACSTPSRTYSSGR
jgi:DNA-binding NtrC family response regulator